MRLLFCFCFFFLEKKRWVEALFIGGGASLLLVPFCYLFFPGPAFLSRAKLDRRFCFAAAAAITRTACFMSFFYLFCFADKAS